MNEKADKLIDDMRSYLLPGASVRAKELSIAIGDQKKENTKLQNQITELRKENS